MLPTWPRVQRAVLIHRAMLQIQLKSHQPIYPIKQQLISSIFIKITRGNFFKPDENFIRFVFLLMYRMTSVVCVFARSGAGLGHPGRAAGVERAAGGAARAAAARARGGAGPVRAAARGPARRQLRGRYAPLLKLHVLSPRQTIRDLAHLLLPPLPPSDPALEPSVLSHVA